MEMTSSPRITPNSGRVFVLHASGRVLSWIENGVELDEFHGVRIADQPEWATLWFPSDGLAITKALTSLALCTVADLRLRSSLDASEWAVTFLRHGGENEIIAFCRPVDDRATLEFETYQRAIPGITWRADKNGFLTALDERWSVLSGRPTTEALGARWLDLVHPDDRERTAALWNAANLEKRRYEAQFRGRPHDGVFHWVFVCAEPLIGTDGDIDQWMGVSIDIDEQFRSSERHETFRTLVNNSNEFVAIADPAGRLTYINPAGAALLGAEIESETNFFAFVAAEDRDGIRAELSSAIDAGKQYVADIRLRTGPSERDIPVACTAFELRNSRGESNGIALVCRDLRDRERFEHGLRVLAHASSEFFTTLNRRATLQNIAHTVTRTFATFCVIDTLNESGDFERIAYSHRNPKHEQSSHFQQPNLPNLPRTHFIKRAFLDGVSSVAIIDDAWIAQAAITPERAAHLRELGFDSLVCVPVRGHDGTILGVLSCGLSFEDEHRYFDKHDLFFTEELARRAGAAISNSYMYEREQRIALTFQDAALPTTLPGTQSVRLTADYRPGRSEATIGGDWYDAFTLEDGQMVIVVGDVVGNGLRAATVMSKLRQSIQTAALIKPDPNFILDAGDALLRLLGDDLYATAVVAIFDPDVQTLTLATAGHPGPLCVDADGAVSVIESRGMLLGLRGSHPDIEQTTTVLTISAGSSIILYTDGLVEINRDADAGLERLEGILRSRTVLSAPNIAHALVDSVLAGNPADDDIAVLVMRFDASSSDKRLRMHYHDVELAQNARSIFSEYLRMHARTPEFDSMTAELVFGELISNVARHAPGPIGIDVRRDADDVLIEMRDWGPGYAIDNVSLPSDFSESSRGLFLVSMFARQFTVERIGACTKTLVRMPYEPAAEAVQ